MGGVEAMDKRGCNVDEFVQSRLEVYIEPEGHIRHDSVIFTTCFVVDGITPVSTYRITLLVRVII